MLLKSKKIKMEANESLKYSDEKENQINTKNLTNAKIKSSEKRLK